jgi:hypothetical protein
MRMLRLFVSALLAAITVSCGTQPNSEPSSALKPFLDGHLTALEAAGQNLPNDEWRTNTGPGRYLARVENVFKLTRQGAVVNKMVSELKPKLKTLSVPDVIHSFGKEGTNYAVSVFYAEINMHIIAEITSRPWSELMVLPPLINRQNDRFIIYQGPQGPIDSLSTIIKYDILAQKFKTNPPPADIEQVIRPLLPR